MMIKRVLQIGIVFLMMAFTLRGQGIDFKAISLKEALEQAKKDEKHVFVLFGTTHCGYSMMTYQRLGTNREIGEFMNARFINVAYGHKDGLNAQSIGELMHLGIDSTHVVLENNEESVLSNYFVSPNFFFLNPQGEITYFFNGSRNMEKRLTRAAKKGLRQKTQVPLFFSTYFNNRMYPKTKRSLEMLSATVLAYHQLELPGYLDFSDPKSVGWADFHLPAENENKALQYLEKSLKMGDYYFNQFLAAVVYDKVGDSERAQMHAKNALENYPKNWQTKQTALIETLLKSKFFESQSD
ncbi:MAG: thioredoxin family protein [Lunatimonas sp.]|uniref:thioredoxin family protein n=1 Tax=Lunatimonas sp. TaxID=2060141 RepID=UPI00263A3FE0|nr:thioredoxin family protein [Lunatimonas sp.]MCC5936512.1 thioredoxin family protein [Lunatimonas sp.]